MEAVMEKNFWIECPECKGEIEIDAKTKKAIKYCKQKSKEEKKGLFEEAIKTVSERKSGIDKKFTEANETIKNRKKNLDDMFNKAKEKADQKKDEPSEGDEIDWN